MSLTISFISSATRFCITQNMVLASLLVIISLCFMGTSEQKTKSICSTYTTYNLTCSPADESIRALQLIFRHGERTPLHTYPGVDLGLEKGLLTEKGRKGSIELGQSIKCRYSKFLSTVPLIKVTSSDTIRTIGTTQALLEGLGLKENISPIRVIPIPQDNLLYREMPCPVYDKAYAAYKTKTLVPSDKIQSMLLKEISKNAPDFEEVYEIYDSVAVMHCLFDVPLPSWFKPIDVLQQYQQYFFVGYVEESSKAARLYNGRLLHEIIDGLQQKAVNFFAGHDNVISTMMEVLGVYNISTPPPYNSFIAFELHEGGPGKEEEVRVFYHGQSEDLKLLSLPLCPSPCTFPTFLSKYSSMSVNDESWRRECKDEKE